MFYVKLFIPFVVGLIVYFIPIPEGLNANAWLYFSIFIGLIIGLILEPISPALIGVIAVTLAVLFKVGPVGSNNIETIIKDSVAIKWGLSGFSDSVVWLIFAAFTIGLGFSKTGLGERLALYLVSKLGKSTLGLGYAIAIVDLVLAPFIPSNAARSGGTVYPIVSNISPMFESYADKNPRKIGAYLVWMGLASSCLTSSIFLTGQAPNPLALSLISKNGVMVVDWLSWFLAFLPVGLILFVITPILGYFIYPPEVKGSKEIAIWANEKYQALGKMPTSQIFMLIIALIGLVLWVGSGFFKINATTTALIMIILMIACKIITWQDFLGNKPAWNTLVWFATLVTMAGGLKNVGFLDYLANSLGHKLSGFEPFIATVLLLMLFSWLRYFFASGTAYVTAIIAVFVSLASSIKGANPAEVMLILTLPMGFMGIITPYGTGSSPLWFGSNYIKGPQFFLLGGIFALIYMVIYFLAGIPWIKFIMPYLSFH
ncbi:DASS family sodium-coupled anion symporter [Campylobacter sp. LH-2024]|uniref:DASS family sodium-coupled anion symporter n=2 Tax=Campylobacter molothri TaxID=1032242 RepID=A0ACC5W192_9BACT|nr:DASS family sodium-coupled anion symporter [Campylobacter sp. RM10542]MBZ7929911.1 DASS family sodium-coupled anion symporter [Campylobacter sp. W0067]MBZ7946524.1 DASS family sodium-coupled anion symporter [Campylobacter sp. RM10536]MBZ7952567.1 DASS family sodium-coupled anion symporter [Campylobacter sp. RM9939]MBZ7957126.1 DASS family sodium-coupled anion symporter [Campylobacter sp. RM10541]MBZ7958479.1 DASS family sodium-coupled anion symporter [Campylobacter sp. RM9760]MBZ7962797.1 